MARTKDIFSFWYECVYPTVYVVNVTLMGISHICYCVSKLTTLQKILLYAVYMY